MILTKSIQRKAVVLRHDMKRKMIYHNNSQKKPEKEIQKTIMASEKTCVLLTCCS